MQTSRTSSNKRQRWINAYRVLSVVVLLALAVGVGVLISRPAQPVRSFAQQTKIETVASLLESVGFNDPVYLGIKPGAEGDYPTFRATAIGGQPVELWIRTTRNGGYEIQPVGVFETVSSADDFAGMASKAVFEWKHMPADLKPRTDGSYGEYESRKYNYDLLKKYNPSQEYWDRKLDETSDWPRK